jgi:protocatechuate 3,4-dioxygenase beta subunit
MKQQQHDHLPGRRDVILKIVGAAGIAGMGKGVALAASNTALLTPEMTEGPYWVDTQLDRSDIIYDPSNDTYQSGFPLLLVIKVYQVSISTGITPLPNAYIDVWQANALGVYSDEASLGTLGQLYLRGYQVTDTDGKVHFTTIYPGWYHGRTPHIHCRVRLYSGSTITYNYTTQFYFEQPITDLVYQTAPYNTHGTQDTYNSTDIFYTANDCRTGNEVGTETMLKLADETTYAVAQISIRLDLNFPTNTNC